MARLPEDFADLVEHWTLLPAELDLLAGKHDGASKLAFSLLLKFYGRYGRFPRGRSELKQEAVEFVAAQVKVPAADLGFYEWGRANDQAAPCGDPPVLRVPRLPNFTRNDESSR